MPCTCSQAEEAYLRTKLAAAIPKGHVLHAAGHKYLAAVLHNPTWTFAKRNALVDRLAELAGHLGKVPAKVTGSPYSAIFSGKVPLVPRLSREQKKLGKGSSYTLPPQFKPAAGEAAAAQLPGGQA